MSADHNLRRAHQDTRNEFALRRGRASQGEIERVLDRVHGEVLRLQRDQPHLLTEDPRALFARMVTPELAPDYESLLRRAAFAVLCLHARDRADVASPTTGDAA